MEIIYWNYAAVGIEFGPRILWFGNAPQEAKLAYADHQPDPQDVWIQASAR